MGAVEGRLRSIGLDLPEPSAPVANYVPAVVVGDLVFVSGHVPRAGGELRYVGKLGRDLDVDEGRRAAALAALNCLASLKAEIGDLDRVRRVVKLLGLVNSTPEFDQQPAVINGASDLLTSLFGARGKHARTSVGVAALPQQVSVEIEMVVEVS